MTPAESDMREVRRRMAVVAARAEAIQRRALARIGDREVRREQAELRREVSRYFPEGSVRIAGWSRS